MNRLRHSFKGHLRFMQLSSTNLFVFVEGKQADPFFYSGICRSITDISFRYEICTAQQLPGATGGKNALFKFFSFLRQSKKLVSSLGSQGTACIFFLDKDVDDLQHTKKRSQHIVYTEHYDVQNYIFMHGDLLNGAASAASVDPARLRTELSDAMGWCLRIARLWREWISLCLYALEKKISCVTNYKVVSRVQTRPCGHTDASKYDALVRDVAINNGQPEADFRQELESTRKKVDKYFDRGQHHRLFKGKWFATVLADDIARIMVGLPHDSNGLASRLTNTVAATIDFTEPWAEHFRTPIRDVVGML